ncbi:MAG: phosphoribosylanthranilate isomerase [Candidatus Omnitrophica bacterium]|nr:phosphoribosylanthranilate isomerase [Candidatus Omnitrophota bacterium]
MPIDAKICGVKTAEALAAAVAGGAAYFGMVFYPRSPRALTPEQAAVLARQAPPRIKRVALLVDPDDETLARVAGQVPLDLIQLHGNETPRRIAEIKARFELPVMKAIKIATAEDLAPAEDYSEVADRLLFDAKAPKSMKDALPGGNAVAFDWRILAGRTWPKAWMLSGGLDAGNLAEAVNITGAAAVDVSSGVEDAPGQKSPDKIAAFLDRARAL